VWPCSHPSVSSLVLVSSPAEGIDPSPELQAAWEAEESALESGDIDAAVSAVVEAWTLADAPAELRELVAAMQRRAFELQASAGAAPAAADPLEEDPTALARLEIPVLVAVGEHDMPDFHLAADELAAAIPGATRAVLAGAGHLAPLEQPQAFRELLLSFLA
jgi:pimeloyl-ACP methyl ester carboxylesterase